MAIMSIVAIAIYNFVTRLATFLISLALSTLAVVMLYDLIVLPFKRRNEERLARIA